MTPDYLFSLQGKTAELKLQVFSSFAEEMLLHENSLVRIDEEMPFDRACLLGCGVLTGVGAVLNTARMRPGESAVVFGCGGVGLSTIQGCRIAGASQVIAIDMVESKLELAQAMGATHVVNASEADAVEGLLIGRDAEVANGFHGQIPVTKGTVGNKSPGEYPRRYGSLRMYYDP